MSRPLILISALIILCLPCVSWSELLPATEKDIEAFEEIIIHSQTPLKGGEATASADAPVGPETKGKKKEVWAAAPGVQVIEKSRNEKEFQISHAERRQWKPKEQACILKSDNEIACGEVVAVTPQRAKVKVNTVIPTQFILRDGEKFEPPKAGSQLAWRRNPKRTSDIRLGLLLGVSNLTYSQTDISNVGVTALSAQLSLSYYLGKRWVILGEGMGYLHAFSMTGTTTPTRLIDVGAGAKYTARVTNHFSLLPQLTYQYETMITPDRAYGYRNIEGPRLALAADYLITPTSAIRLSARATLYGSDTARVALTNKKLGGALSYFWDYRNSMDRLGFHLEYSTLNLNFSSGSVSATTISSYLSYAF